VGEIAPCAMNKGAQELLVEFQETGREEPFAEIARRYAGMVYNVALQVTHDAHDAEDATQATFLTLAVHARTTGKIRFVGPWLRKVSHRLALDIRRSKKRRVAREERHSQTNGNGNGNGHSDTAPAFSGMQMEELRQILREELDKLPAKYRLPLILYYFGGLSPLDMGKELNCNTSTLGVRLHRGRKMLADNLAHRGITIPMSVMIGLLTGLMDTFVKDNLVHSATHSAAHVAATHGALSAHVFGVMRTTTSAMAWMKPRMLIAVTLLLISTLTGASVLKHLDVLNSLNLTQLKHLNLGSFLRPLLDHLRTAPMSVSETDIPDSVLDAQPSFALDAQLTLSPAFVSASLPSDNHFISSSASVVSASHFAAASDLRLNAAPASSATTFQLPSPAVTPIAVATKPTLTIAPPLQSLTLSQNSSSPVAAASTPSSDQIVVDRNAPSVGDFGTYAGSGDLFITGGSLHAHSLIVGDKTSGSVTQTGGDLKIDNQLVVANQPASTGTVQISGSTSTLSSPTIIVGNAGNGTMIQSGGTVAVVTPTHTGTLTLGAQPASSGAYILTGGTLVVDNTVIGQSGTGSLTQTGGSAILNSVALGENATGIGTLSLSGGSFTLSASLDSSSLPAGTIPASPTPPPSPIMVVGEAGSGTVVLNPSTPTAIATDTGVGSASLIIRSLTNGSGTLQGWGTVAVTGPLIQNGRVIADGFGQPHTLDLSSASFVSSTIPNSATGGANGWFAQNGGSLVLPPIKITGEQAYNWGDDQYASTISLVNSVRFTPHGLSGTGTISMTLLDPKSTDIPQLPVAATSLWQLDSSVDFTGIDLTVRYDDAMAAAMQIPEDQLRLWVYENGWQMLDSSLVDTSDKLISASIDGMPSYFATAPASALATALPATDNSNVVPEPAAIALLAFGCGAILRRRRRN
jgi:RNA polymerase sigma factor (sigma-70 family)